jgi:prephenate dehydratase
MIGYLGQEGSYAYFAACEHFNKNELIPHNNLGRLFYALDVNEVEGIVVPFENIKDGTNFDVLGRILQKHYHISKELILDVQLNVVSKNHDPKLISGIFATEESINEGYNKLKKEFGKYKKNYVRTDRDGLNRLHRSDTLSSAAVVSKYEHIDDCNIVLADIRDSKYNIHKYVYITRSLRVTGTHNKILVALSPKFNQVGALYDVIHEFVIRGVNIVKILSQPMYNPDGDTIVFLELDGNLEEQRIKDSIIIIKMKSTFFSIVGSYIGT